MKAHRGDGDRSLAVFIDFENMGLGFNNRRDRFEINKVLERLVEKGKIVAKKAYADWSRFGMYTAGLHEAAIELVEIPRRGQSGKNSADIRLVVDAIDLAYSKDHIDTFVIVSGDSDFAPLVSKLKELGKHVIGLGLVDATSDLLRDNCDEFIYYEDLDRAPIIPVAVNAQIPERKRKVFALLLDSLLALRRENKEVIYSSMVKDTMKRKKPSFNEEYYGYRTFSELLEDAQKEGLLEIEKHKSSGMYIVTRFGLEMKSPGAPASPAPPPRNGGTRAALPKPAAAEEPRDRGRDSGRTPPPARRDQPERLPGPAVKPAARPALEREEEPSRPADRPLGRELVEDFDVLDEPIDEIPSYRSARPTSPPAAPAPRSGQRAAQPKAAEKPPAKPAAPAKPAGRAAKPAAKGEPARAGARSGRSGRSGSKRR
ncbi:MAG TPA: NYN domain-containing protein, partial [Gemmataceae bacterium]|nr:NYN domain-containing protein [Gemmataceae bacterium]